MKFTTSADKIISTDRKKAKSFLQTDRNTDGHGDLKTPPCFVCQKENKIISTDRNTDGHGDLKTPPCFVCLRIIY